MFADSLLENHWTNHGRRGSATLASFALETMRIAILLMLPLIYTEGLPKLHLISMSAPLPPPGPPPIGSHHPTTGLHQSNIFDGIVVAPPTIPIGVKPFVDDSPPNEGTPCAICVPGGVGPMSIANSIPGGLATTATIVPPPPTPVARPPRLSQPMEAS